MKNFKVLFILIIVLALFIFLKFHSGNQTSENNTKLTSVNSNTQQLLLLSTNPNPLEGAVILPDATIQLNFNKRVIPTQLKHNFDPPIDDTVTEHNQPDQGIYTLKISFKKPLELGNGYTLFIQGDTHSEDGIKLGQDFNYHFRTINYNGV